MSVDVITGYNVREGSAILAERLQERTDQAAAAKYLARSGDPMQELAPDDVEGRAILADLRLDICDCGETRYRGRCHNVGACRDAEKGAVRQSLSRGTAASARPSAWNLGGSVD